MSQVFERIRSSERLQSIQKMRHYVQIEMYDHEINKTCYITQTKVLIYFPN